MQHAPAQLFLLLHEVVHHNVHIADPHSAVILVPVKKKVDQFADFQTIRDQGKSLIIANL